MSAHAFEAVFWTAIAACDDVAARHVLRIMAHYWPSEAADLTARVMQEAAA